ncbi:uncharacterized protein BXZ73DRAFT_90973 [Epithele typhae]|uniref:uncharacterized protein n=1 Tax=Epithele typhae TaxID=378194 RepID=UPI002007892C|nr:uncharacterized protein BXZ73DRAFT_90973 [Epithele typhae]KAH9926314.1 hypothetical protein BXZ73DRAFT_90973 [Epithele typhae]
MKLSTSLVTAVYSAVTVASAIPFTNDYSGRTKMMCKQTPSHSEGALYWITNHPEENSVIAATINKDGSLNIDRAVSTGGRGLHGNNTGPDGLYSQGSVVVSTEAKLLATVNAGSNTLSLFTIDPKSPTKLTPLGYPISSGGEFPISVAFNPDGSMLCALNGGSVAGVNCYSANTTSGLTLIPGTFRAIRLNQTYPPTGPLGTASQVAFSPDGAQLIASVKGTPVAAPGFLATWSVSGRSLTTDATMTAPPPGGLAPFSLTPVPGRNAILSADPAVGVAVFDLDNANASSTLAVPGQAANCWSAYSNQTGNYYLADIGTAIINEVHVDENLKPTLVKGYQLETGSGPIDEDVVTVNGKDFLYVLTANQTAVDVLALSGGAGNAKKTATLSFAGAARQYGVPIIASNLQGMAHFLTEK